MLTRRTRTPGAARCEKSGAHSKHFLLEQYAFLHHSHAHKFFFKLNQSINQRVPLLLSDSFQSKTTQRCYLLTTCQKLHALRNRNACEVDEVISEQVGHVLDVLRAARLSDAVHAQLWVADVERADPGMLCGQRTDSGSARRVLTHCDLLDGNANTSAELLDDVASFSLGGVALCVDGLETLLRRSLLARSRA